VQHFTHQAPCTGAAQHVLRRTTGFGLVGPAAALTLLLLPLLLLQLQVVDLVMLNTFADLDESAVDSDPLLLLLCGHVFTTSTLDGWMNMSDAYEGATAGVLLLLGMDLALLHWLAPQQVEAAQS
jgi:hypothetical protein